MEQTIVIPLTGEPGTDMYWHGWAVLDIEVEDWSDETRASVEDLIERISYESYEYGGKDQEYIEELISVLTPSGVTVKKARVGNLVFAG